MDVLDRVDQHEAYDPVEHYKLDLDDESKLTPEELAAKHGREPAYLDEADAEEGTPAKPKRLDG